MTDQLISADSPEEKSFLKKLFTADGWMNILTGVGMRSRDKRESMTFDQRPRMSQYQLESRYSGDDISATICSLPAREMTREWITLKANRENTDDRDPASDVLAFMSGLGFRKKVKEAVTWARVYGGSAIVLGVDDGAEDPSEPLNEASIRSFTWMTVLDRWDLQVHSYYNIPGSPKHGKPETYMITSSVTVGAGVGAPSSTGVSASERIANGSIVHETRLLRFDGALTTRRRQRENSGWSDSVLERSRDVVRDFNSMYASISALTQDMSQAVFSIKGLAEMLAHDEDDLVLKRLQILDMARSVARAVPIDADGEKFERTITPLTGVSDIADRYMMRVSAAARMPVTLLFGRSPSGMDATGESDIRLFYDNIGADQEDQLRDPIEYVIRLVFLTKDGPTKGVEPDWFMDFNSLWQESSNEKAETRKTVAETDEIYVRIGAIDPAVVTTSRWGGDEYSPEMTIPKQVAEEIGGETQASVSELSLTLERAARIGDINMVNAARRALAKRLGMEEVPDVTIEELGAAVQMIKAREAEGAAQGRSDYIVEGVHTSGEIDAPNYRLAPEIVSSPDIDITNLENAPFSVCDNCGFEEVGVCRLFDFAVDPEKVCDQWTSPEELVAIDGTYKKKS